MKNRLVYQLLFLLLLADICNAVSIGVTPGKIDFNNLLRNGYAERTVRITTNSQENVTGHFTASGDIVNWISFVPNSTVFTMSSPNPFLLKIIIRPPNDTRSDSYSGEISFITDYFGSTTGRAGGFVKAGVTLKLSAVLTDKELLSCGAGAFSLKDIESGFPLELVYLLSNNGNVRIAPIVKISVWDQLQEKLVFSNQFTAPELLPTVEEIITKKIDKTDLDVGQYWASISIDQCMASSFLTFNVVEKGGINDKGVLEAIENKGWSYVNDPVEIIAKFRNTGPRIVSAKFKGTIKLEDELVKAIESDEIDVESGSLVDLKTDFTPKVPGRYLISGRVIFNKKFTFEKASIINVTEKEAEAKPRYLLLLVYLIILITIIFLLRKIIKAKKRG